MCKAVDLFLPVALCFSFNLPCGLRVGADMSPATSLLLLLVSGICAPADSVGVVDTDFPYLPPLLRFNNGTAVETVAQWENERRTEIKELLGQYLLGTAPSRNPSLLSATEINSTQTGIPGGGTSKFFSLVFERNISFDVEVVIPPPPPSPASPHERDSQNDAAFPVFVTQWNHREWALLGVNRGYVGVVYPGADTRDAAPQFQAAFPNESMALIRARALVASCTLDFILAPPGGAVATFGPHPLNASQICATGHRLFAINCCTTIPFELAELSAKAFTCGHSIVAPPFL